MKKLLAMLLALSLLPAAAALGGETVDSKTIYLAGGCFWGMEHLYSLVPGVTEAVSGYANGAKENPTYEEVCRGDTGHRETVKVTYDAARVSLESLLKLYFTVVDPLRPDRQGNDVGTQYQAGVYWADEDSRAAVESAVSREKNKHLTFAVEAGPLTSFYPAETYHQDYLEKNPGGYCHIPLSAFENARNLGGQEAKAPAYRAITAQQAKAMRDSNHSAVYLDVRTPEEYQDGHLPDAVNLPLDTIGQQAEALFPDKDTVLLVYCRSGRRSQAAAQALVAMGYTDVYDFGGIIDWPFDIVQ